jgi:hypothetical protein
MSDPRRIGVLTFHRSINYGSYWQARALVEGLGRSGDHVELLDHDSPAIRRAELRCAFQPLLPVRSPRSDFPAYAQKVRSFADAVDRLPRSSCFDLDQPEGIGGYDVLVVGSDEVWNFHHPWFGGKPLFFGDGLQAGRLVSYAASFGNYDAQASLDSCWTEKLARFAALSVRDDNSRRAIEASLGVTPALALDPILQFSGALPEPAADRNELIVYGHSFPAWFGDAVRRWAERAECPIVSLGYRNDWADEQVIAIDPVSFAARIGGARAVATNFFHGCAFALAYRRPLAAVPSSYRLNKVTSLLDTLRAGDRLVPSEVADGQMDVLLGTPPSEATMEALGEFRVGSAHFLDEALAA